MAQEPTRRALRQSGMPRAETTEARAIRAAAAALAGAPDGNLSRGVQSAVALPRATPIAPGFLERLGNTFQEAFPGINAARTSVVQGATDAAAKGDYARAAGNVVRGAVTIPLGAASDTVAPITGLLAGAAPFVGGLFGSRGDAAVTRAQPAAAAPAQVSPREAVTQALAQGRTAPAEIAPQDALAKYITSVLSGGATIREAQALGALVPAVTKGAPKAKDSVLGQTAALSEAIFTDQVTKIDEAVKSGTITPEQAVIGKEKATAAWFARNGGLVGFDPSKLVQAQLLEGTGEEE